MGAAAAWRVDSVAPVMVRGVWGWGERGWRRGGAQQAGARAWASGWVAQPPAKPCVPMPGLTCGRPGASWAFLSCPPEDECANGHHDCNETQNCRDRPHGYECSCKTGYTMDK